MVNDTDENAYPQVQSLHLGNCQQLLNKLLPLVLSTLLDRQIHEKNVYTYGARQTDEETGMGRWKEASRNR